MGSVSHVFDCATGEARLVPLGDAELRQRATDERMASERAAAENEREAELVRLRAALASGSATTEQQQRAILIVLDGLGA